MDEHSTNTNKSDTPHSEVYDIWVNRVAILTSQILNMSEQNTNINRSYTSHSEVFDTEGDYFTQRNNWHMKQNMMLPLADAVCVPTIHAVSEPTGLRCECVGPFLQRVVRYGSRSLVWLVKTGEPKQADGARYNNNSIMAITLLNIKCWTDALP